MIKVKFMFRQTPRIEQRFMYYNPLIWHLPNWCLIVEFLLWYIYGINCNKFYVEKQTIIHVPVIRIKLISFKRVN